MNKNVIVYISGSHEYHTLKGYRQAVLDYAKVIGLPELKSEHYLEEVVPGSVLDEAMSRAGDGSIFITNTLASFGHRPSHQRQRILALLGRGCDVHVLGLGRVDEHLAVLKNCWETFSDLERQLLQLEMDLQTERERLADDKRRFEDKLIARMAETMGHGAVKQFYTNGHGDEVTPSDPVAIQVRELREQKGWSQEQLAEKAQTSKSQIYRIEHEGKGEALSRVLSVLEHDGWQPQGETKWVEQQ